MFPAFRAMLRDPESKALALAPIIVIAIGTVVYVLLERWTVLEAVYFCVVTLATVGYGDLHPTTELGRLFTIGYILSGLGIIAAFVTEPARYRQVPNRPAAAIARPPASGPVGDAGGGDEGH